MRQEGDLKFLYKLKVDDAALQKRNINARMTDFRKKTVQENQIVAAQVLRPAPVQRSDSSRRQPSDFFDSEFGKDTSRGGIRRPSGNISNPAGTQDRTGGS